MTTKKKDGEQPNENTGGEQARKKEHSPRVTKHVVGSPHEILHTFVDKLNGTEATVLHRAIKKHYNAIEATSLDLERLDDEATSGIKSKLA